MGRFRLFGGSEVHGDNDIKPGKGAGDKVKPQSFGRDLLQLFIVLAVEDGSDGRGEEKYHCVNEDRDGSHGYESIPQGGVDTRKVQHTVAAAEDGLNALGDAGIDGDDDQGEIGDDAVGGHTHIAFQIQDDGIEYDDYHTGGYFRHQRRHAAGKNPSQNSAFQTASDEVELIFSADKMGG